MTCCFLCRICRHSVWDILRVYLIDEKVAEIWMHAQAPQNTEGAPSHSSLRQRLVTKES